MQGNLHGKGTYYGEDTLIHQETGPTNNGEQNGAVSQDKGKNRYEGDWNHGMKHGSGIFIWADGSKYQGNFKDDQFNGDGEYTRADGKHYKGNDKTNILYTVFDTVQSLLWIWKNLGLWKFFKKNYVKNYAFELTVN